MRWRLAAPARSLGCLRVAQEHFLDLQILERKSWEVFLSQEGVLDAELPSQGCLASWQGVRIRICEGVEIALLLTGVLDSTFENASLLQIFTTEFDHYFGKTTQSSGKLTASKVVFRRIWP